MNTVRTLRLTLTSKFTGFELPARLRGGIFEKWFEYWKHVGNDYRTVYMDTRQDMRDRPKRAAFIGAILAGLGYLIKTNPNEEKFMEQIVESSNLLSRVPATLRNPVSYDHVQSVFKLQNQQILRHQSLGFFSLIYREDYGKQTSHYAAQCTYTRPSFFSYLTERIIDVGINGEYQLIKNRMLNYDVNTEFYNTTSQESQESS